MKRSYFILLTALGIVLYFLVKNWKLKEDNTTNNGSSNAINGTGIPVPSEQPNGSFDKPSWLNFAGFGGFNKSLGTGFIVADCSESLQIRVLNPADSTKPNGADFTAYVWKDFQFDSSIAVGNQIAGFNAGNKSEWFQSGVTYRFEIRRKAFPNDSYYLLISIP